jgi:DNA polymerase-4
MQLKLRYKDFTTITRARTIDHATQLDGEIYEAVHALLLANWKRGQQVRLLGVHAAHFISADDHKPDHWVQGDLLAPETSPDASRQRWEKALSAVDRMRDKFGESSVSLASGLKGSFRERAHENPASLPGKKNKEA